MSFSTDKVPAAIRNEIGGLCRMIRTQALAGANAWSIDPAACFRDHGFVWAAVRKHCSVDVLIDQRKGKVHTVTIELPDECALVVEQETKA